MDRRHFCKHLAAASSSSLLSMVVPRVSAYAQVGLSRPHFFIYVFASGGWDPTMVFEIKPGLSGIDVDPEGDPAQSGNIDYFHNPDRPWVKTFFDDFGSRSCVINGVNTQSVSHSVGTEIMMTGGAGIPRPDWPTIISSENGSELLLPHMALSGPSFSGTLGSGTSSGTGFLSLLLFEGSWTSASATAETVLDAYNQRRFESLMAEYEAEGRTGSRFQEMDESFRRWRELKNIKNDLGAEFDGIDGLGGEGIALATAFEKGYAITGTLEARASWDSHSNNNPQQNNGFDDTFQGLHEIVTHLANRPATSGPGTLLDQTTLIVMSEMGRTPKLNGSNGKDHWPITSVLMVGAGIEGNQVIGSTDDFQNANKIDFATGLTSASGLEISAANIGSTLLSMAGLNPNAFLPSTVPEFTAFRAEA